MEEQILAGIRVVDLSSGLAGPVATQILAEAGADVIKLERPGGDPVRSLHPTAFATWNRSKRSIVLDAEDSAGRATLDRLLAAADVLVHDLRPAHAARLGLDDHRLRSDFPRLVSCAITGYPANHADAERPSYDLLVQARSGLMDFQAGFANGPFAWRFFVPSWYAVALAVTGIAARLFHRQRTGEGGPANTTLVQGARLAQSMVWSRPEKPPPAMAGGPSPALRMNQIAMYECADGAWIQILNPADKVDLSTLPLTIEALERLGLGDAPFDADVFAAAMTQFPSDEWVAAIRAADVSVELIAPLGGLLTHPEVEANGFVVDVDDPVLGASRQAGTAFGIEPPMAVRRPAPTLGQHQDDLAQLLEPRAAAATSSERHGRPLEGVKVLDLGAFLAGPLAPMLMADLGADVIKVEPPRGDLMRGWRDDFYIACNRGKRGVALDITSPSGREAMNRMIAWADVVHHNVRLAAASRLGIDRAGIQQINPRAVFGHASAYGVKGERTNWPGYDSVFQAMSGWSIELAGEGNPPLFNHLGNLDMITGTLSAAATILALYHRERTGEVTATQASLLNTATFTNSETAVLANGELASYPKLDHAQTGLGPGYRIYQTADAWVAVVALDEDQRAALRALAGVEDDTGLDRAFSERKSDEVLAELDTAGVAAERVEINQFGVVWDDPENLSSGVVVVYPQADWGTMHQFGAFWQLGDLTVQLDRACPALGEHTHQVLGEFGYGDAEIFEMARNGLVGGVTAQ